MSDLSLSALHASLSKPVLEAMSFLNEIMSLHPGAVSFAPGAPHPETLADVDVQDCLDRFVTYLEHQGRSPEQARRVLYEYGPSRGLLGDLLVGALEQDEGIQVDPAAIVITVGAQEAMFLVLRALFGDTPATLAVVNPCYVGVLGVAEMLGLAVEAISETPNGVDLDQLETACQHLRASGRPIRVLYTASEFSNPGGGRMSLPARKRLLELAEREDFLVLDDGAYAFTAPDDKILPSLKVLDRFRRVIYVGTFAKIAFPGARVGFVIADQTVCRADGCESLLADGLVMLKSVLTVNTSPLSQGVIGGLLLKHGGSLRALGRAKAARYRRNLDLLLESLDRHIGEVNAVRWNRPQGGFFVVMDVPVPADADLLKVSAARYGVLWTPMSPFHLDGGGERQLRLSCSYLGPDDIEEGVRRLTDFLRHEVM